MSKTMVETQEQLGTLHRLVEDQAARTPQAEALRFEGQSLSYAELNTRANQVAHFLRALGMGPDRIVGVVMERSFEMITALLGILKSGSAWLPLDPDYPAQRLNFILDDAAATVVLTQARFEALLQDFDGTLLSLDREWKYVAEEPEHNPEPAALPHHLAYVIYTSGSTGQPKGCMLPHAAICNRLIWMRDFYGINAHDRILQKTPYTFDVSVWELFLPLLAGACEVIAKPDGHRDAAYLVDIINSERVTVCHFVPSMLRFFLGQANVHTCKTLRHVYASGEALPFDLMCRWLDTLPGAKLHNLYGPTEAAVDVSYWQCERREDQKIPIGRAIDQIELLILDEKLERVGEGEAGELHIGGIGLARGYLNRPELTRKTFIPHPFSSDPEARLYKTGDKASWLPDDNIEYLGRLDTQVKLRGFRIELGEIEATLRSHDGIKDAAVAVQGQEDPRLVAYLVGREIPAAQIKAFVKDRLPEYMVPNQVAYIDELPVSRHGKLDRKALPWPLVKAVKAETKQAPAAKARVDVDKILAALLAEFAPMMMVDQLGADEDLFDAGATSLTVVLMVERIQAHYGVTLPVDEIMDAPTVGFMARYVAVHLAGAEEAETPVVAAETAHAAPQVVQAAPIVLPEVHFGDAAYEQVALAAGFDSRVIDTSRFGRFLSLLQQGTFEGKPKYRYASAGGLNPIQTYVWIKASSVAGVDAGIYYYHPLDHKLHLIQAQAEMPETVFALGDRAAFEQAGFVLFLIAQMDAIKPVYQATSPLLAVLEAGYMAQLLISRQHDFGLALRPLAGVAFEQIEADFHLDEGHQLVHCLLGGSWAADQVAEAALDQEVAAGFADFLKANDEAIAFPTPGDKERLLAEQRHIRKSFPQERVIPLASERIDALHYVARSCKRNYLEQPVEVTQLAKLLALMGGESGTHEQRQLYPAFSANPALKVYLYVKPGGVNGIDGGLYCYDAAAGALHAVADALSTPIKLCYTPYNRKHAAQAQLYVFLVAAVEAGREDRHYLALLQAGYMGQLLLDRQAEFGLGLCPIGGLMFDKIRMDFKLEPGEDVIHSFVGGGFRCELPKGWQALELPQAAAQKQPRLGDLAIVGLSGRYPGGEDLEAFADLLERGQMGFSERVFDGTYRRAGELEGSPGTRQHGGFLNQIEYFDAALFKMTPIEARSIDPQERLLLESVWSCLENAGYTAAELNRLADKVGVFAGAMWSEYQQHAVSTGQAAVAMPSSLANRISHFFGFKGPSVAVNTSCSSAMTALHYACKSIGAGDCKAAIVGGVNLMTHPYHLGLLNAMDFLSKQQQAQPFGLHADGWVAGEGVGTVIVKSLADAQRDGDHIYAVIKGTALGYSGQAGRYGAPSTQLQKASMLAAIEHAGVAVDSISYVEAAVSGASVADALETKAIKEVFRNVGNGPTLMGSVKGNIGHLESASAMSQLTKVLLQMQRGKLFATLNTQPINPMLQPQAGGLEIVERTLPWQDQDQPRRALINAFGATGSAGHLVLEAYPRPASCAFDGETLVPLSAATPSQLRTLVERLYEALDADVSLADVAHTLRVGRVALPERLVFVSDSVADLREKLAAYLRGEQAVVDCFQGQVAKKDGPTVDENERDWRKLAQAWVKGAAVDWSQFVDATAPPRRVSLPTYPFARDVAYWVEAAETKAAVVEQAPAQGLASQVEAWLVARFAKVTELPAQKIDAQATFDEFGINSFIIHQFNLDLEQEFGQLPKTLLFEYQTIHELVGYFIERHGAQLQKLFDGAPATQRPTQPRVQAMPNQKPQQPSEIAIVGISGRYPKANDLDALWQNLKGGVDCISEIPAERWNYHDYYQPEQAQAGKMYTKWGGFIDGVDQFDPLFFKMSPLEAEALDPQERLFLQTVWHTFEDANYNRAALRDVFAGNVGVFVGVMSSDYQLYSAKPGGGLITAASLGSIANRISYFFDFHGPSMAVDTLCSSSLTALHLAVESIKRGECRAAIAGGVNLSIHPNKYIIQSQLTMTASDGRCRSFGEGGDGFIPGEGVGAVLVKPLADAIRDQDRIYGVIKGTSINHDGKTHGYTVPNPNAQAEMIAKAIKAAGVEPDAISYIEAHGTGTSLGDPVEIAGLSKAFSAFTQRKQFCAIGSIKSNIGHLEAAAGMAGLSKILLQMKHGMLAPSLHTSTLNPNIDFSNSPFYVQRELSAWERPERDQVTLPRIAGLSSFGAGGANAHVVIEEYRAAVSEAPRHEDQPPYAILLSAKDEQRLREVAVNLVACLDSAKLKLRDLAFTLQVGRESLETRLAFMAGSLDEVRTKLDAFLAGDAQLEGLERGKVKRPLASDGELLDQAQALAAWIQGVRVDWARFYGRNKPHRVTLPLYPFARERYWLPQVGRQVEDKVTASVPSTDPFELLRFEESWVEQALAKSAKTNLKTLVCLLSDPQQQVALRKALQRLNPDLQVALIAADAVDDAQPQSYQHAIQAAAEQLDSVDGVLYLWACEDQARVRDVAPLIHLVQALEACELKPKRLLLAANFSDGLSRCYGEAWIGFARSLKAALPQTTAQVVLQEADQTAWLDKLVNELAAASGSDAVLYTAGKRAVLKVHEAAPLTGDQATPIEGTILITGGLGGLGLMFAKHLSEQYGVDLVLCGRSPLDAAKQAQLQALQSSGNQVAYLQADVSDETAFKAALVQLNPGPITGVIHAAGLEPAGHILHKSAAEFEAGLQAKVRGTLVLDEVLADQPLAFVCYFSSTAAVLGDWGACDYAMANRFQTAYAAYRNQLQSEGKCSGKTFVCNWPMWDGGGMGQDQAQTQAYLQASGQRLLGSDEGLALFDQLLRSDARQLLVFAAHKQRIHALLGIRASMVHTATPTRPELRGLTVPQAIRFELIEMVAKLLKIDKAKIDLDSDLSDYGFDSVSLANFAQVLTQHYGFEVAANVFFGHSTLAELTRFFLEEHSEAVQAFYQQIPQITAQKTVLPQAKVQPRAMRHAAQDEPIAIIGMSGRFPQARSVDELWRILEQGQNAVQEIPLERFDWRDYYGDPKHDPCKTNCKWSGNIPGVAEFDAAFFEISPREAERMDPRQRLLLQEAWNALEDAGYGADHIAERKTGMFVGVEEGEYQRMVDAGDLTSFHTGILAARLAYFLNLKGPTMAINTACSSSLVAAHQACQSLRNGDCDTALAAGVNLMLTPEVYLGMSQAGMLSDDGTCFTFDQRANGMVPGEAVAVVVLKRMADAVRDGDPIHAIIPASGVNYDGKTSGITAPSSVAQAELLRDVYSRYHIKPEAIDYVIAHGTGTPLGDAVEIRALDQAFKGVDKRGYCALTSTKTNFGHTFAASGLVSLISMVQALRYHTIPASLHCEQENNQINWQHSPFFVNKAKRAWPQQADAPRTGAVSSFGMSGTNAHMIVQDAAQHVASNAPLPCYLLAFSAKTEAALQQKLDQFAGFMAGGEDLDLAQVSYTLLAGRHHFRYRLALVVVDLEDANFQFSQLDQKSPNLFRGLVPRGFEAQPGLQKYGQQQVERCADLAAEAAAYREALCALADLYSQGYDFSWTRLFGANAPSRVHLPTYPFARDCYWVDGEANEIEYVEVPVAVASQPATSGGGRRMEMTGLSVQACLAWDLKELMSGILKIQRDQLEDDVEFSELGFDSIRLAELANVLSEHFKLEVQPSVFFGYPTLAQLVPHLLQTYDAAMRAFYADQAAAPVRAQTAQRVAVRKPKAKRDVQITASSKDEPIAIIGMSGRFPQSQNVDQMWQVLASGQNAVTEIPSDRFDWRSFYDPTGAPGKTNCKWLGSIADVKAFDALFFEISPREAEAMDPRQRLLLQEAWHALEDAGYGPERLQSDSVGMFVGAEQDDYQALRGAQGSVTSSHNGVLAARLAYFMNLTGPNMAINTACSSGLVAAHQAWLSLRNHECDVALAAGVNLVLTPTMFVAMSQSGMLSPDGKCHTFDQRANGMVPGEAVAVLVFKRLSQAERDGDTIYAVIEGSGVNYDGKTNGITAPSGVSQVRLLQDVYKRHQIDPNSLDYIVTHGTGTKLGDPIEINALAEVFKERQQGSFALTSSKTNFGHTFAASGLVSLIGLVQAMRHETIPASLHCDQENDFIQWQNSPFYVNKANRAWPMRSDGVRRGAVSAFGISGTNAHMVVRDYQAPAVAKPAPAPYYLLVLSAQSEAALQQKVSDMSAWLEDASGEPAEISYTLLTGRHHFLHRCALVARDLESMRYLLQQFGRREKRPDLFQGKVPRGFEGQKAMQVFGAELLQRSRTQLADADAYQESLFALADLYCQGYDLAWSQLFGEPAPRRVRLPGYPFEREEHWVAGGQQMTAAHVSVQIHPLLQRNVSDFNQQRFSSTFTGFEPFLADHVVNGRKVLPGVIVLEMARAALAYSYGCDLQQAEIQLKNVVWREPVVVDQSMDVHIGLTLEADDWVRFDIYSLSAEQQPLIHAQGMAKMGGVQALEPVDLAAVQQATQAKLLDRQSFYEAYRALGMAYGDSHQAVETMGVGDQLALARLKLPASVNCDGYVLHPSIMDGALQTPLGLFAESEGSAATWLPFALEGLEVHAAVTCDVWAVVREAANPAGGEMKKLHIDLCDDQGQVLVRMHGFTTRIVRQVMRESQTTLTGQEYFLEDHYGILPGVVYLEMARAAASSEERAVAGLRNVIWREPIRVNDGAQDVTVRWSASDLTCSIATGATVHFQAKLQAAADWQTPEPIAVQEIRERCTFVATRNRVEHLLKGTHGPRIQSIEALHYNGNEACALLKLPADLDVGDALLNPSLMNGAVLAGVVLALVQDMPGGLPMPFALDELRIHGRFTAQVYAYVRARQAGHGMRKYDIELVDSKGNAIASLLGLALRFAKPVENKLFATQVWQAESLVATKSVSQKLMPTFVLASACGSVEQALRKTWPAAQLVTLEDEGQDRAALVERNLQRAFELLQSAEVQASAASPLVLLLAKETLDSSAYAGLLRTARSEQLKTPCKIVVHAWDAASIETLMDRLKAEMTCDDLEVRYTAQGVREVKRAQEIALPPQGESMFKQAGVVWITGGLGGLGTIFARHYGPHCKVVLSGRSPLTGRKREAFEALRGEGLDLVYVQGDVCDAAQVAELVRTIQQEHGALSGIIHAAGVLHDAYIAKKTAAEISAVLRPKVAGTLAIDEATRELDLDFFVLCSSLSAVIGNPGQADYAAANAFLDAFAGQRNQWVEQGTRRGKTLSIGWPLWREGGMSMNHAVEQVMERSTGMTAMDTAIGLETLNRALQGSDAHVLVAQGTLDKIRAGLTPQLSVEPETAPAPQAVQAKAVAKQSSQPLQRTLVDLVASLQKISPDKIELDAEWSVYGFDSIGFTEFANHLNQAYGLDLMPTIFYEYATIASFTNYLQQTKAFQQRTPAPKATAERSVQAVPRIVPVGRFKRQAEQRDQDDPIAIIGMHGRFPGSSDLEAFWQHLAACDDLISTIPADRWDWRSYYGDPLETPGKTKVKAGGFIEDVACFDPLFFGISPREAETMDPQFRLFLQTVWATIEHAGYAASSLAGSKTGVFVGASSTDYKELWQEATGGAGGSTPAIYHFIIANRISYLLDLHGPSEAIDTACSSSLIAIHRAVESIRSGNCEMALAGGVNVMLSPNLTLVSSMSGMLSEDGRCRTFDESANGYGRGEGVGAILLKPLSKALADGDQVFGLIRGSAENHGGRATSPTAPNPASQQDLLVSAYNGAGIDPRTVGYIEAHGTGTKLGDPIEINGLKGAFKQLYAKHGHEGASTSHCAVGSLKSNIGHLEAAAGIAGVIKVLLMLKHRQIPGNVHLKDQNPYLQLDDSPFYLARETQFWPVLSDERGQALPRRAGVSSFGIGGSNAHLVLEEFVAPESVPKADVSGAAAIVLSAKNRERLVALAGNLLGFLETHDADLYEVAYTLQVGREAMKTRLGFMAESVEEVRQKLRRFCQRDTGDELFYAELEQLKHTVVDDALMARRDLDALLRAWIEGAEVDWRELYGRHKPRRIELPTYPFEKQRYWAPEPQRKVVAAETVEAQAAGMPEPAVVQTEPPQWLFMQEDWRAQPLDEDMDWVQRLSQYCGKSILLVYSDQRDCDGLHNLLKRLVETAQLADPPRIDTLAVADIKPDTFEQAPDVVLFLGLIHMEAQTAGSDDIKAVFRLSQSLMKKVWGEAIRIFYIYVTPKDGQRLDCQAISGFVKSAMMENELHTWKLIECGAEMRGAAQQLLVQEWLADQPAAMVPMLDMEIGYHGTQRTVKGLAETKLESVKQPAFRKHGTYVLAGAMGYIGELLARKLAANYQANLVLLSRRQANQETRSKCRALEALGAKVHYYAVDIADREALTKTFAEIRQQVGAIHGVVNLTRAHEDCMIANKTWASFQRVIASKVEGTQNLDALTREEPLDFFLMFSSLGAYGVRGSADYAYATAFQNAFAHQRNGWQQRGERSGVTVAQSWGAWVEDHLFPETRQKIQAQGFRLIDMEIGFPVIEACTTYKDGVIALMAVENAGKVSQFMGLDLGEQEADPLELQVEAWEQRGGVLTFEELQQFVEIDALDQLDPALIHRIYKLLQGPELESPVAVAEPQVVVQPERKQQADSQASQHDLNRELKDVILKTLCDVLKLETASESESFQNYGLDSISATVFATRLEKLLDREVSSQWLLDFPTVNALAAYLMEQDEDEA